jgi:low affinity Fe/Cu permease
VLVVKKCELPGLRLRQLVPRSSEGDRSMNEHDDDKRDERTPDTDAQVPPTRANLGPLSRVLHSVGMFTSKAAVAATVALATVTFMVLLWAGALPDGWESSFVTLSAAVTVVMVFVIQHTQSRQQLVTQLKLDELVHSSPDADDRVVHLEAAADDELAEVEDQHLRRHTAVRREEAVGDPR